MFPISFEVKAIAALALVAGLGGWHLWDVHRASSDATTACKATYAAAALAAETANRAEEQRRQDAAHDNALETQRLAARGRAAAAALAGAPAAGLRAAVAARIGQAASDPPAGVGVKATAGPDLVLADVLRSAEQRLRDLAGLADTRGNAGSSCERSYDSLNPQPPHLENVQ